MKLPDSVTDEIVFHSHLLRIGAFRCKPWQPWFEDTGPTSGHLLVFPRTSVHITHPGQEPVVANPNVVMFYNAGARYRRSKLSERGDLCEWYAFQPQVIADALSDYEACLSDNQAELFKFTHGPSDRISYLLQRRIYEHIRHNPQPDRVFIEETMLAVLRRVLENTYRILRHDEQPLVEHKELAHAVQTLLATRFQESLSLEQIAGELYYSPYHICRIFRQVTGYTIHKYINQLRLRTALEKLADGGANLTNLALDLGFSSHSHFTQAFKKLFGAPPSQWKSLPVSHYLNETRKILIA
jgi:AraC family transcriptional regulator